MPKSELFPDYNPKPADGVSVGESPVPGLTLKRIFRGNTGWIGRMAWGPDGHSLATPSENQSIHIWDVTKGTFKAFSASKSRSSHRYNDYYSKQKLADPRIFYSVTWSPNGKFIAAGADNETVVVWSTLKNQNSNRSNRRNPKKIYKGHSGSVYSVAWSPDGNYIASGARDETIRIWDETIRIWNDTDEQICREHTGSVYSVAWSPDGEFIASASADKTMRIWSASDGQLLHTYRGHTKAVYSVAWSPDGKHVASAGADQTIYIWNTSNGNLLRTLEGHSSNVNSVTFSADGHLLASKGQNTIRLWRCDSWACIVAIEESTRNVWPPSCIFNKHSLTLATLCEEDTGIRIWNIDKQILDTQIVTDSVQYTTAKIVLVGDSGVGKTGLGWRLAHNHFKEHSSTHGQQFWVIDDLCKTRDDGTECEAVLWDLAGQHVYRPIHSIFLDNVDASLVLFDPTNRQDPLKGAQFWIEQLKGKEQLPPTILVGARMDRGGTTVSQDYLEQFCQQYSITGGYIGTSAKSGEGLDPLIEQLKSQIPWDEMTTTVTTVTFKRIKDYVLALKEKTDRKGVLVQPKELRQQLQAIDLDWQFTDDEMMTAVGHLETHGYVTILKSSEGDTHILLAPDLLVDLASSTVLVADKHPRELGAVNERELLQGEYSFDELEGLEISEQQILFDAAVLKFLEHNICFRETLNNDDTVLIFPGLIKQKRPLEDDFAATDDVSYVVRGRIENLYSTLVVLLGYTPSFVRINHWQKQAQYATGKNEICGFRMIEDREGEIELILYYSDQMLTEGREQFQELFERFLYQRDVDVTRFPPVVCANGHPLERATVVARLRDNKNFAFCSECGIRVEFPELEQTGIGTDVSDWLKREEATAKLRSTYEQHLSRVKGYRRSWATPRCYVSYAPEQASYIQKLIPDLQDAGVYIVTDVEQVQPDDYVLILDTSNYRTLYKAPTLAFFSEAKLTKNRLAKGKHRLLAIKLEGGSPAEQHKSRGYKPGNFSDATHYPVNLFNLVLNLYAIPLNHASFRPLRESLHRQWEQTLSYLPKEEMTPEKRPLKVFISYAHEDEVQFKDKFLNMLGGLQRRGLIDAWEDRQIRPGDDWYAEIQKAMHACDMAVLLISDDFINSRFINEEEVPKLLKRRQSEGMRVVPIIIRPCPWDLEPMFRGLQALPKDGKPVITFPNDNGERDQAWTDVAKELAKFAKELQGD